MKMNNGFTLVELMIVVAIIGVIVSIAIPAYLSYTHRSSENACLAEAKIVSHRLFWELNDPEISGTITQPVAGACKDLSIANGNTGISGEVKNPSSNSKKYAKCTLGASVVCKLVSVR